MDPKDKLNGFNTVNAVIELLGPESCDYYSRAAAFNEVKFFDETIFENMRETYDIHPKMAVPLAGALNYYFRKMIIE